MVTTDAGACGVDGATPEAIGQNRRVQSLRIVFAGSPDAAVPSLRALAAGPHDVVAVSRREDSPHGRKRVLTPTPVAVAAERARPPRHPGESPRRRDADDVHRSRCRPRRRRRLRRAHPRAAAERPAARLDQPALLAAAALARCRARAARDHGGRHARPAPPCSGSSTSSTPGRSSPSFDARSVAHETAGHLLEELANSGAGLLTGVVDAPRRRHPLGRSSRRARSRSPPSSPWPTPGSTGRSRPTACSPASGA